MKSADICMNVFADNNIHYVIKQLCSEDIYGFVSAVEHNEIIRYDTVIRAVAKLLADELGDDEVLGMDALLTSSKLDMIASGTINEEDPYDHEFGILCSRAEWMMKNKSASKFHRMIGDISGKYRGDVTGRMFRIAARNMHQLIDEEEDIELQESEVDKTRGDRNSRTRPIDLADSWIPVSLLFESSANAIAYTNDPDASGLYWSPGDTILGF